ncbi:MAG: archease [Armatimonadota bacterium]|jgi:SHS2 domain-containing protein
MAQHDAGHEPVEHTADLAIRAWAPDLRGLIEEAARGMLDLMLTRRPEADAYTEVVAEGRDPEELVVDCLREVLALWTVARRLPVSVDVTDVDGGSARCTVGVAGPEEARDALGEEIKAVTYHGIEVVRSEAGYEVTVVFDV